MNPGIWVQKSLLKFQVEPWQHYINQLAFLNFSFFIYSHEKTNNPHLRLRFMRRIRDSAFNNSLYSLLLVLLTLVYNYKNSRYCIVCMYMCIHMHGCLHVYMCIYSYIHILALTLCVQFDLVGLSYHSNTPLRSTIPALVLFPMKSSPSPSSYMHPPRFTHPTFLPSLHLPGLWVLRLNILFQYSVLWFQFQVAFKK